MITTTLHPVYIGARAIINCPSSAFHNCAATVIKSDNINGWTVKVDAYPNVKYSFETDELIVQHH
jgi:hypothetical protein